MQECIISAASHTHGYCHDRPPQHHHKQHAWYDDECKAIRKQLKAISASDSQHKELAKHYARVKRRKRRQAQLAMQEELCQLACSDAQKFWRRYRKQDKVLGNISPEAWGAAFSDLYNTTAGPEARQGKQDQPQGEATSPLHTNSMSMPVFTDELTAVFRRLKRNKAAGIDGVKAEFLLDAEDLLLQPLALTFTQMLADGVPQSWCSGVIHPIFKSGDVNDPGNYRGITVTSVLAKLFAMTLEARMSAWAEVNQL